jgi:hypothetical protein
MFFINCQIHPQGGNFATNADLAFFLHLLGGDHPHHRRRFDPVDPGDKALFSDQKRSHTRLALSLPFRRKEEHMTITGKLDGHDAITKTVEDHPALSLLTKVWAVLCWTPKLPDDNEHLSPREASEFADRYKEVA